MLYTQRSPNFRGTVFSRTGFCRGGDRGGGRGASCGGRQRGPAAAGAVAAAEGERGGCASGSGGQWPRTRLPSHVPHASPVSGRLGHCAPGPGLAVTPVWCCCLREGSGLEWALGGGPRRPGGIGISSVAQGTAAARLPCPSPTREACSNSCPSSRGCHPSLSSSVGSSRSPPAFHQGLSP